MTVFKIGDRVERIDAGAPGIRIGDVGVISKFTYTDSKDYFYLEGYDHHSYGTEWFKLIESGDKPSFVVWHTHNKPFVKGQRVKLKPLAECEDKSPGIGAGMSAYFDKEYTIADVNKEKGWVRFETVTGYKFRVWVCRRECPARGPAFEAGADSA